MRAGTLNERITIKRPPAARDSWGERTGTYTTFNTFNASVTPTGGKEGPASEGTASSTSYTVRIRYSSAAAQIATTDRIEWRGITIDIISAVPDERRTEIIIAGVAHHAE